jgi:hypothetical protein
MLQFMDTRAPEVPLMGEVLLQSPAGRVELGSCFTSQRATAVDKTWKASIRCGHSLERFS